MLLTAKDNENVFSLLQEDGDYLEGWLSDIKPWKPEAVPRVRSVWLRVLGVPVHAWGEDFFRFLAELVGRYVETDVATSSKSRLDIGRILVTVSSPEAINKTVKVKVNEHVFLVRLVEEVIVDQFCLGIKMRNNSSVGGYSSDYSDAVEDSFLGMPVSDEEEAFRDDDVQRQKITISNSNSGCKAANPGLAEQSAHLDSGLLASPKATYYGALNAPGFTQRYADLREGSVGTGDSVSRVGVSPLVGLGDTCPLSFGPIAPSSLGCEKQQPSLINLGYNKVANIGPNGVNDAQESVLVVGCGSR